MKKTKYTKCISVFFILLSIIFMTMGGIMDMTNREKLFITKQHFWNDGIFLAILGVFLYYM